MAKLKFSVKKIQQGRPGGILRTTYQVITQCGKGRRKADMLAALLNKMELELVPEVKEKGVGREWYLDR
jgi:negative regulator of replication initiation